MHKLVSPYLGSMHNEIRLERSYEDRFEFVRRILEHEGVAYRKLLSLDLGCRWMELQKALRLEHYKGVDFNDQVRTMSNGIYYNLEMPLPYADGEFEIVYALDVLEHLENMHGCLAEIRRVSQRYAVISLPNLYHYLYRLKFLLGHSLGTKYLLPLEYRPDRHRWIFTLEEALGLVKHSFRGCNAITVYGQRISYRRRSLRFLDRLISKPSLGANTIFFFITL